MLINSKKFRDIFKNAVDIKNNEYNPEKFPYIGLGCPDSNILFVGSEKKEEKSFPNIIQHELNYNFSHWNNLVSNYNGFKDNFHPKLKLRGGVLNHFNPFSPLTLDETSLAVYSKGSHTYMRIEIIINSILHAYGLPTLSIYNISPKRYNESLFSRCFLTELSDKPMPSQNGTWDFNAFKSSPRANHMINGELGDFYKSFKKVVIYAGKKYTGRVGSTQREEIIKLFNPYLCNGDMTAGTDVVGRIIFQKYVSKKGGAEVIVTENHIITKMFNSSHTLGHYLGVIGIGNIN
jgi:hypothetical protein